MRRFEDESARDDRERYAERKRQRELARAEKQRERNAIFKTGDYVRDRDADSPK